MFALRVYPELGINTLDDWKKLFAEANNSILNEYGTTVSASEMIDWITNRSWKKRENCHLLYKSWDDFHQRNHSEFGPNNLLRSKIDGDRCIGHGEGTWDYFINEFS